MDTTDNYFTVKSIDAEKKSKNIVATLPKALAGKYFLNTLTLEDQIFEGIVLEIQDDALPIISVQHDLISLRESVPKDVEDINNFETVVGIVSSVDRRGITLRFLNAVKKLVLVKDLETVQDFLTIYKVGKVVRAAKNKLDRLTLKQSVIYHMHRGAENEQKDREAQITSLFNQMKAQHASYNIKVGEKVQAQISLVKDYGNIVGVEKYPGLTGFILTEHLVAKKEYKEGQKMSCVVLDIDFEKEILDLSEKLAEKSDAKTAGTVKVAHQYRAVVELNKEDYLLISFKQSKGQIGILQMQSFNGDDSSNPNDKLQVGDEVDVRVIGLNENSFILTTPVLASRSEKKVRPESTTAKMPAASLVQGQAVNGVIKSIKGFSAFIQLQNVDTLVIGRLHKLESQSGADFDGFSVGENIKAKILKVSQGKRYECLKSHIDKNKTWIELTRRREHLNKPTDQLDEATLAKTIFSIEEMKQGKSYDALITDVNYSNSRPIQVSVSAFVKGGISFDKIVDGATLTTEGSSILQMFKAGITVKVFLTDKSEFSLIKNAEQVKKLEKGDLFVARLVKGINGKGITV